MSFRRQPVLPILVGLLAACGSGSTPPDTSHPGSSGNGTGGHTSGGSAGTGTGGGGSGGVGGGVGGSAGIAASAGKSSGGAGAVGGGAGSSGVGASGGSAGTGTAQGGMAGVAAGGVGALGGTTAGGQGGSSAGMAGSSAMAGSGGSGGGTLHGGASGKFVCAPGATYGNPLTGMGTVTSIGPPTMGTPNYFAFVEGPIWIASLGKLFFSDNVSPERIWMLTPGGTPSVFQEMTNSNGLALDNDDQIVITDQEMNRITRLDPTSSSAQQMVIGAANCKPNDAVVRSDGNIYYTAPNQTGTGFYRMTASGMVTGPRTDVGAPNGVDLSPDENTLYIGDVNNKQIAKFAVDADGVIAASGTLFVTAMNSTVDGLCVDCAGNLYADTSNGVEVYSPDGTMLGIVPTGESSNCTFGGTDRKTLYVTSRSVLKTVTLAVPGLPD
jgi:gluconolactonase